MSVGRIEGYRVPASYSYEVDLPPAKSIPSKGEQEKIRPAEAWWYTDTVITHPERKNAEGLETQIDKGSHKNHVDNASYPTSSATPDFKEQFGWDPRDSVTSAAAAGPTPSWLMSWVGSVASSAVESVKNVFGVATTYASDATTYIQQSANTLRELGPSGLLSGAVDMARGLWNTLTYAERAFSNPNVKTVEIPTVNPDGTRNPFGGRRISREDYHHLLRMQDDVNELLARLDKLKGDGDLECFVITIMKLLAEDKTEDLDNLRVQLSDKYRDRKADTESALELMKKIRNNPSYDWFLETSAHTSMALGGLALGLSTGTGWPLMLVVVGGAGLFKMYLGESKTQANQTEVFGTAWKIFATALAITAPIMSPGSGAAVLNTFLALPGISQGLLSARKAYVERESGKIRGEHDEMTQRQQNATQAINSLIKELASSFKSYNGYWKRSHHMIKSAADLMKEILRRS